MANAYSSFTTDVNQTKTVFAYTAAATGRPTWSVGGDHQTPGVASPRPGRHRQACASIGDSYPARPGGPCGVSRERAGDGDRAAEQGEASNAKATA
jgi:hypothetical protein